jgi:hypothetical protein
MSDLTGEQIEWLWRTKKSPRNVPPEVVETLVGAGLLSRDDVGTLSLTPSGVAYLENPDARHPPPDGSSFPPKARR